MSITSKLRAPVQALKSRLASGGGRDPEDLSTLAAEAAEASAAAYEQFVAGPRERDRPPATAPASARPPSSDLHANDEARVAELADGDRSATASQGGAG